VYSLCKKHCNGVQSRSEMKALNKDEEENKVKINEGTLAVVRNKD
jgi:hypothetical protein